MLYYVPRPLIDQAPQNDTTSLTTYTMHPRASDTNIYIHVCINIHQTHGKATIGMALQAIKVTKGTQTELKTCFS